MKKIYLMSLFIMVFSISHSQVLQEPFDDDSQFTLSTDFFSDGSSDFFGISGVDNFGVGSIPSGAKTYSGFSGNYLNGMDLDGEGASLPIVVDWLGLDISGLSALQFSGDFAEAFDSPGDIDDGDYILVEVQIDGGGYVPVIDFRGADFTSTSSPSNGFFRLDTDQDGTGDGALLDGTAQNFSAAISGTGNVLDLRLSVSVNSGDEDFAVDNFLINTATSPVVGFGQPTSVETETNSSFATSIAVTIANYDSPVDLSVTVTGGTAESGDYTLNTSSISFAADGTQDISIDINPDVDFVDETIQISIVETTSTGVNISSAIHTITIIDDDGISCGVPEWFTKEVILNSQSDTWFESSSGTYEANGFTGTGGDISEVWLVYGPLDMTGTSAAILEFDLSEGFDGGTGSSLDISYTSTYTGNPGDAGNSWVSVGSFLGTGDDDVIDGVADLSAASGSNTYLGIKYTADGASGASSSVVLSNIELVADVCPASGIITWDGSEDTNWINSENWDSNSVPDENDYVVIASTANDPIVSGDAAVYEIKVVDDEVVTVSSGASLAIFGGFSGRGDMTIVRNTNGSVGYSIIGSPVSDAELIDLSADFLYGYSETDSSFPVPTGSMVPGVGYFVGYNGSSPSVSLTGNPNSGTVTSTITLDGAGFNLVANPYAAAISMSSLRTGNDTDIDGVFYLWDDGGTNAGADRAGDYITASSVEVVGGSVGLEGTSAASLGNIASVQGFFVHANNAGSVSFTPDMQVTTTGANVDANHYREASSEKQSIRLSISGNGLYNEILVGLRDDATLGMDIGLDALKFSGNELIAFYSMIGDQKFAIQTLPKFSSESIEVQLGIDLAEAGSYKLNINEMVGFDENTSVILVDNYTGKFYDLNEVSEIDFINNQSVFTSKRFELVLAPAAVLSSEIVLDDSEMVVFTNDLGLNIITSEAFNNAEVKVYSLSGSVVSSYSNVDFSNKAWATSFDKKGLFILKIESENGLMIKKFLN